MNKEERKTYNIEYYYKNRERLLSKRRKWNWIPILKDYHKYNYLVFIEQEKPLWRYINENKLFDELDYEYIENMKPY